MWDKKILPIHLQRTRCRQIFSQKRTFQEITLNGGYSSSRPAQIHFGLGAILDCELEVTFPNRTEPVLCRNVRANQTVIVTEP